MTDQPTESTSETANPEGPADDVASETVQSDEKSTDGSQDAESQSSSESTATDAEPTGSVAKSPIRIGSQRDPISKALSPSKPKAVRVAATTPIGIVKEGQVGGASEAATEPSTEELAAVEEMHTELSNEDLDKEIEAALGGMSLDDIIAKEDGTSQEELEIDSRVKATVIRVHADDIFFGLKGRYEGVAAKRQFLKVPELGDMLEVVVTKFNSDDGLYEVSVPGASVQVADWSDLEEGTIVEARITGSNTGGLECSVNNIRGFIPASQIDIVRVENLGDYVNSKLQCVVTEANPDRRNLVLSHRAIIEREREKTKAEKLQTLQVGALVDGVVTKLMDFGAFVDIGGVEGLVHISKMSWSRVEHPKEIFTEGQQIQVKIEKIDPASGKIGLSYRDTMEHPWMRISDKYAINTDVEGVVSRIAQFGAFVRLEPGIEGLVHISEIAHHRVQAVKNYLKEGDKVTVKILSIDPDAQKMALSIKATEAAPVKVEKGQTDEEIADTPRPLAVPARNKPLKGGTNRDAGGDQFGLKW